MLKHRVLVPLILRETELCKVSSSQIKDVQQQVYACQQPLKQENAFNKYRSNDSIIQRLHKQATLLQEFLGIHYHHDVHCDGVSCW